MISTIRVVAMTLNLVRRHNNPLFIFSSPSEQSGTDVLDFGRVAVFVAATFEWLVGACTRSSKNFSCSASSALGSYAAIFRSAA
jgi:hypothetical protein